MVTLTEDRRTTAHYIVSEAANIYRSREQVTIGESASLKAGMVLGHALVGDVSSAAKSGGNAANTGTFVLDNTTPALSGARPGVYKLRCIAAATNGGTFRLEDPYGFVLGDFAISGGAGGTVTVAEQIKGVITDGSTDFSVGEGFDITVADGGEVYLPWSAAALDGSQIACAILWGPVDASDGAVRGVITARDTEVVAAALIWPDGTSDNAKNAQLKNLAARGIIAR